MFLHWRPQRTSMGIGSTAELNRRNDYQPLRNGASRATFSSIRPSAAEAASSALWPPLPPAQPVRSIRWNRVPLRTCGNGPGHRGCVLSCTTGFLPGHAFAFSQFALRRRLRSAPPALRLSTSGYSRFIACYISLLTGYGGFRSV